jgi:hypothetical protein
VLARWVPPVFYALVIFRIGSHVYACDHPDRNPIYASCVAGMAGICYHAQLLIEMGSC